jgi:hypothetical protein
MLISCHQNLEQTHNTEIAKICFKNVAKLKYSVRRVTNANLFREEIKSRLNSGNACYHSVQNLLLSYLLFKSMEVKRYRSIILPVVLFECQTCSLTLREEHIDSGYLRTEC